jgi:hypothetical protein
MKSLRIVFIILIFSCFSTNLVEAQALVIKGQTWTLYTGFKSYETNSTHAVFTPKDNFNIVLSYQFDTDDPFVPEKRSLTIDIIARIVFEGVEYEIPGKLVITPNGHGTATFHWKPEKIK